MNHRVYSSLRGARDAMALDAGYDVWLVEGRRCTRRALAAYGYVVDAAAAAAAEQRQAAEAEQGTEEHQYAGRAWTPADDWYAEQAWTRALAMETARKNRECDADMMVMRRIADRVAATGAPVAHMELYGSRGSGTVRLTYHDGRRPTYHRIDVPTADEGAGRDTDSPA